jgi:lysophospholipase
MAGIDYSMINNWFRDEFEEGFIHSSADGLLRYSFKQEQSSRGTIVIVPGRTEFIEKYVEVCWDLRNIGYSICVYDHLGQGKSARQLNDPEKGHITDFTIYVSDLVKILESVVLQTPKEPVYLLAHSMGATISSLASQRCAETISGLILVSPMFQINTGIFLPPILAEALCEFVCLTGGGSRYVWGGGPFNPDMDFTDNPLTSDPDRFRFNSELARKNREIAQGSPTFGWLQQAYKAMRQVRGQIAEIPCPTIIFRSIDEHVVGLKEMENYCNGVISCQLVTYRNCRHELLMERDEIRSDLFTRIRQFLTTRG